MSAILNDIKNATWLQRFVWANVALFLTCALVVEDAANAAMFFLFVVGIVTLVKDGWPRDLSRGEKWLLAAFALYFLVGVISYNLGIKTRLGWEIIFRDIRFLFAIPAYLALRRYPPPNWLLWSALVMGAFALAGVSLFAYLTAEAGWRVGGTTISIVFGHLAVSIALACATGAVFLRADSKQVYWRLLLCLGVLAASVAVVLSGTRGAWVALLGAGGLLFLFWWWRTGWRQRALSALAILVLVSLTGIFLYKPIASRFNHAVDSWQEYQSIKAQLSDLSLPESGCINQPEFLKAYIHHFNRSKVNITEIVVVKDPAITEVCPAGSVIRLQNTGAKSDWPSAIRIVPTIGRHVATVVWWVKGRGSMQLGGTKSSRVEINTDEYQRLELTHPSVRWPSAVTFIIPAGRTLYVAPVQIMPGEYTQFYTGSSVASRLQMWEAAARVFAEHPIVGAGTGAWRESTAELIENGIVSPVVVRYDHAHNDYLTLLADRGLLGLATLLLLYGVPLWLFVGAVRQTKVGVSNPAAMAGIVVIGGFMLSGLTETLFNHSIVITYYAVLISIFVVCAREGALNPEKE